MLDLLGTFVFALSGAVAGVRRRLDLFGVAGAQKALVFGLAPVMAALLGMLTGVGAGVARDVLLSEIPAALCFGLRLAAIRLDWHLPVAQASLQAAADAAKAERRNER